MTDSLISCHYGKLILTNPQRLDKKKKVILHDVVRATLEFILESKVPETED